MPSDVSSVVEEKSKRRILGIKSKVELQKHRTNKESAMSPEVTIAREMSLKKLKEHYTGKYTIADIIQYLESKLNSSTSKKCLDSANFLKQFAESATLSIEEKDVLNQSIQILNKVEHQGLKTIDLQELIAFINENKPSLQSTLPLCFHAAKDVERYLHPITQDKCLEIFFSRIRDRRKTCRKKNLGIEALQGLHNLILPFLDDYALNEALLDCYSEVLRSFLDALPYDSQLDCLRRWDNNILSNKPIINIIENADIKVALLQRIKESKVLEGHFSTTIEERVEKFFYSVPPFVAEFFFYIGFFEQCSEAESYWLPQSGCENWQQHAYFLSETIPEQLFLIIQEQLPVLKQFPIPKLVYIDLIKAGMAKGFPWFIAGKGEFTLSFNAELFIFTRIAAWYLSPSVQLDISENQRERCFQNIIQSLNEENEISAVHFTMILAVRLVQAQLIGEALYHLQSLQYDSEKMLYWLLSQYITESLEGKEKANFQKLIIHFYASNKLNLQNHPRLMKQLMHNDMTLAYYLLPLEHFKQFEAQEKRGLCLNTLVFSSVLIGIVLLAIIILAPNLWPLGMLLASLILISIISFFNFNVYMHKFAAIEKQKKSALNLQGTLFCNLPNYQEALNPLKSLGRSWKTINRRYKTKAEFLDDLTVLVDAINNILLGGISLSCAAFQTWDEGLHAGGKNILYSFLMIIQGFLQLAMLPLYGVIKIPSRLFLTTLPNANDGSALRAVQAQAKAFSDEINPPKEITQCSFFSKNKAKEDIVEVLLPVPSSVPDWKVYEKAADIHQQLKSFSFEEEKQQWKSLKQQFYKGDSAFFSTARTYLQEVEQIIPQYEN